MMDVFKTLYVEPGKCISVERAVDLDAQKNVQSTFSPDVYRQPVLTEPTVAEPQFRRDSHESPGGSVLSPLETADDAESGKFV